MVLIAWGSYSMTKIPLDAVPDITNNQVQVITQAPDLATQEVERFITYPLEVSMSFIPDVEEIRSISRFGLSVITVVFKEEVDPYLARQLVGEKIRNAEENIPEGFGKPELAPLVTGLSEIYQYTLALKNGYDTVYSATELRTIQDWIVKRQLAGVEGVAEVSSFGGFLKQYEVAISPERLRSFDLALSDIFSAIQKNNQNTGGSYIEKNSTSYFIRGEGMVKDVDDIRKIVIKTIEGVPLKVGDVAEVRFGAAPRFGAITRNGEGETVGGLVLMLRGGNSYEVTNAVKTRIAQIQKSLPEGILIDPFLDRSELIDRAIDTVTGNLIEGGLIVIFILVLLLGNLRAGFIVASVIPLSMLFALGMMHVFGVSANLMSLGAIDFGLIIDGAVIIVEAIVHRLSTKFNGRELTRQQMDQEVGTAAERIRNSAAFGEIIILIVYLPILSLVGIEGKMFAPMAKTVSFAIMGAFILSLTYVPMMSALFLDRKVIVRETISDKIISFFHRLYEPVIKFALRARLLVVGITVALFGVSLYVFSTLGGEFIPTLEEGDIASHQILPTGTSLSHAVEVSDKIQKALMAEFPEVKEVVTKIGTAEIPTDPMPVEVGDIIIVMKDKKDWTSADSREEMFEKMEKVIYSVPGVATEFTQPIQMRFNELMTGVRQDVAVKIYGEDLGLLFKKANEAGSLIEAVEGVGGAVVEQITGLPQIHVNYDRDKIAQYGLNIQDVNQAINTAFAGGKAGVVFEGERRFDLIVRFEKGSRVDIESIRNMYIPLPEGGQVPVKEVALVDFQEAPAQISRDDTKRRIVIGVNTRGRDVESVVKDIRKVLEERLDLPPGYFITYGGQFENLIEARERLSIAVPVALGLIFVLLFFTFNSFWQALLIFTAVPMSAIGGVFALYLRDMPFSISAGVGFIALFGVAVLNGIVLIGEFNHLKKGGMIDLRERILTGTKIRLRPVILTASVASFGFLPMALSGSAGAEVQKPLATVVIGGLVTATFLTLVIIPVLYYFLEKRISIKPKATVFLIFLAGSFLAGFPEVKAQDQDDSALVLTLEKAVEIALERYPTSVQADLQVEQQKRLKKTAFDMGPTTIYHQKEETNGSTFPGVVSFGFQQNIDFPTTVVRRYHYQKEKIDLSLQYRNLTRNNLAAEVSRAYNSWLIAESHLRLMKELENIFKDFESAAKLRFETGETGKLEFLTASGQAQKVDIMLQQAQVKYDAETELLKFWLNTDKTILSSDTGAYKFGDLTRVDSSFLVSNPLIGYYRQNLEVSDAAYKLEKSQFLPQFNVGYSDQKVNDQSGFYLYRIGVNVPLLYFSQLGSIQASRISRSIAEKELDEQQLVLQKEWTSALAAWQNAQISMEYYQNQGLQLAEEQISGATLGYKLGEVNYIAFVQSLNQAMDIRRDYLASLFQYNEAVIELNRLSGNFFTNEFSK